MARLGIAATTCEFDGCKYVFGVPFTIDALLFLTFALSASD